ncbi:hypothetical protein BaRGS_00010333 [Batillaria attramentaria]|uniref:Uncharacterized protein n=1 Tax=Batillaria attramentaria TaxID=370345 RepID=A0ABD0LFY5_9CAEN
MQQCSRHCGDTDRKARSWVLSLTACPAHRLSDCNEKVVFTDTQWRMQVPLALVGRDSAKVMKRSLSSSEMNRAVSVGDPAPPVLVVTA